MVSLHISTLQTATWILAICMSEYSGVKMFNFPNLVCFFKESSAGQIKGLSGPDVARGVSRQFVERHFVYDTSSTDISSNDISSTSVSVSITANQQRPLSYSFAKTCYIFSGIQLLITEKIIFINPAFIERKLSFIHASSLVSSFYLR